MNWAPAFAEARSARREPARAPSSTPGELPLFVRGLAGQDRGDAATDGPMVVVPPVPRAPLAVRRGMPEAEVRALTFRSDGRYLLSTSTEQEPTKMWDVDAVLGK